MFKIAQTEIRLPNQGKSPKRLTRKRTENAKKRARSKLLHIEHLEDRQMMAVNFIRSDLEFMLQQIVIAEQHASGADLNTLVPNVELAYGLRTVTGEFNHLMTSQTNFGAADVIFPRLLDPVFRSADGGTTYQQLLGTVIDAAPRTISNLIVDQTPNNPAMVEIANQLGLELVTGHRADGTPFQTYVLPNETADAGLSAPFNAWMTFFGQFFDHGLDLVSKGGSGTVFIPLAADDPLFSTAPGALNFMIVTRATNVDGVHEHNNSTSPFVDQNQTYSSHPSHQVFLREYKLDANNKPQATGRLIVNRDLGIDGQYGTSDDVILGGMATWAVVKAQARDMLGINLTDADVNNLPLLATDDYGQFIRGTNGFAQLVTVTGLVEGDPTANGGDGINIPTNTVRTGHAFLDDIAHTAAPRTSAGVLLTPDVDNVIGGPVAAGFYDNELLDAHFIAGDGRVNENIGLTAVHHVFHAEHNRLVDHIKNVIVSTGAGGNVTFLNEWLLTPVASVPANLSTLDWNGERLFQAAKFGTEMQYQHLVFEEFARTIQPNIDAFLDFDTSINPAITAEFAHVVYRFGHSMLTETIDRLSPTFQSSEIGLIQAFLNPLAFTASGPTPEAAAGAIIRGVTRQVGNEIDEFVTEALRNNLVGLPLDLPAINIARGRDTGIPSLNAARRQFFASTSDSQLAPYTSWADFAAHLKHPESLVNFVAAYGKHSTIASATTLTAKRDAASLLVLGGVGEPADRLDFMNSTGAWASDSNGVTTTGLDDVDLWMGGLAEQKMPFGGMLGSTFNFVFETQLEALQNGDRFYYLHRLPGTNFFSELENNSFSKIIMANTDATHLPAVVFTTPAHILEVNPALQQNPDPVGDVIRDNPATPGADTNFLQYTGVEHVVLGGTNAADILISSEGDDTLWGDGGNDRLEGGFGNDETIGGDGDDIITDAGGDDVLKGETGNDVIQGGNGINLIIAGPGNDFIITGEDESEVFAGTGNDFILGSPVNIQMAGNEGDDWIEVGTQDGAPGDNFDPLGLDPIIGNDVFVGTGQFDEMIGEGGDDIAVGSDGPDKFKGMSGYDWVTFKNDPSGVHIDLANSMLIEAPLPASGAGVGMKFFQVEALSGSQHGDILRGDDSTALTLAAAGAQGSILTNVGLITGLQAFLGANRFDGGNIILGGGGSDIIEGRGGNDRIDGDRFLNVRISVRANANGTGAEIASFDSLQDLVNPMLNRQFNPGQLVIVRELLVGAAGLDTVVFSGPITNYTININGGVVTVSDNVGTDGVDRLTNIERLLFGDGQTLVLVSGLNAEPVGLAAILDSANQPVGTPATGQTLRASVAGVTDADNPGAISGPVTFTWQVELVPGSGVFTDIGVGFGARPASAIGATFTVTDDLVGLAIRVKANYIDANGVLETVFSAPTAAVVVGAPVTPPAPLLTNEQPGVVSAGIHFLGSDLQFILDQITIAERHAAGENLADILPNLRVPHGLRTVTGEFNNLVTSQTDFGAADVIFPRLLDPVFRSADGGTTYQQLLGTVIDAAPRTISNLIVDQTPNNPAMVEIANQLGLELVTGHRADGTPFQTYVLPNETADAGLSAPFNSWMTFFGQFFDHGLDLVSKGGSGTVFIPLAADDPLFSTAPGALNFMIVTRATNQKGPDGILGTPDDIHEHNNSTSPFVDQNQTYSSHPSHQVFLREYKLDANNKPQATGRLIVNRDLGIDGQYGTSDDVILGGMATWAVVKAQARDMLGINLTDADVNNLPLLATDDYGQFLRGTNGFAQLVTVTGLVEGDPTANGGDGINIPTNTVRTGHAFLDDIAHTAAPRTSAGVLLTPDADNVIGGPVAAGFYDNELLDAHFIAGDGRVNENIGLTAVHHVFHAEHNRLVDHVKDVLVATGAGGDVGFLNQWLLTPVASVPGDLTTLDWNGERLFQAAKFGTEMQYQHLVFEEFARAVSPGIDVFLPRFQNYDTTINPAITAEFAHVVYRFGHSMLTETIDRLDPNFNSTEIGLIQAFLNPLAFTASGPTPEAAAGAIIRGVTRQVGNEIDEFVTEALRNNLVGLPLDLPAINIARGRDTGIPSLNAARREFFRGTGDSQLRPYISWADFGMHLKHPESLVNFVAAYGRHSTITSATTIDAKRIAAGLLVLGGGGAPADRLAFMNSTGTWASLAGGVTTTGLDDVDLWIGGLAEQKMPFGGMLGSTFNFVFETQLEALQNGDRFYYLERTGGQNFLTELENSSFSKLIMANTNATHLPGLVFTAPGHVLEVNPSLQQNPDPAGDVVRDNPNTAGPDTNFLQYTGVEHVVLGGTSGADIIIASEGDDTLWGDGGNDQLEGGFGNDIIRGGLGDDIITDAGGDDVLHGEEGNDVIHGGNGINLILGGFGSDFIITGEDASEAFGGPGNDFIIGAIGNEQDMGNEGDDWLENGLADGAPGDNFTTFGEDRIIGNDVFVGTGVVDIMIGEGGDDIFVGNTGGAFASDKYLGGSGYDWATFKSDPTGVDMDLGLIVLDAGLVPAAAGILSRFRWVEGLSGSHFGDTLKGDDSTAASLPAAGAMGSVLTNIALIDGLQAFLGVGVVSFAGGNILLGGGGGDILEGRGGDDLIDGDRFLNVRISVRQNSDGTGAEIATFDTLEQLAPQMLDGTFNPGQLVIVREILMGAAGYDTVYYAGPLANYTITIDDGGTPSDFSDDFVLVTDNVGGEGTDRLTNIERLQFNDQVVILVAAGNEAPVGLLTFDDATPTVPQTITVSAANVTDADNITSENPDGHVTGPVAFFWQVETAIGSGEFVDIQSEGAIGVARVTGPTFEITPDLVGLSLRVRGVYEDANGTLETVFSATTAPVAADAIAPTVTINQAATQSDPTNATAIHFTVVFSEAVTGLLGNDIILGGTAGATTATISGSGTTYQVAISGMVRDGTVTATVRANAAQDASGNQSTASTSTDNSVLFDGTAPIVTAPNVVSSLTDSTGAIVTYNVTATDATTGVASLVVSIPSGSHFNVGTTIVNYTAIDLVGNVRNGSFTVTVRPVGIVGGELFIAGNDGDDVIVVNAANPAATTITFNGATVFGSPYDLTAMPLRVFGNGGNDSVTLNGGLGVVAHVEGGTGINTYIVSNWNGTGSLTGGGADILNSTRNADIALNDASIVSETMNMALSGIGLANLGGGAGANAFTLTGWTGNASLAGSGGTDTLVYENDASYVLANASLAISPVAGVARIWSLNNIQSANLTGGASNNTFDLSGWTGTGTIDGANGTDTVNVARNTNYTLANTSLTIGASTVNLAGIENANLTGGAAGNTFNVSGWTGTGTIASGGGNDNVVAAKDANFTLTDTNLTTSDGVSLALVGIAAANLTGGANDNSFDLSSWSGTGSLDGAGGTDTVVVVRDTNFTLANTQLTIGTANVNLTGIETANLTGGVLANTFIVSGWTGGGTLSGAGGLDSVVATKNTNFTATDANLTTGDGMSVNLLGIGALNVTGGAAANTFTLTGWTGAATVSGAGGSDTLAYQNDASFVLTNTSLAITPVVGAPLSWTLNSIEVASLTGGASNNTFELTGWTGTGTFDGAGGTDTVAVTRNANFTLGNASLAIGGTTVNLAGIETANLTGGAGGNTFTVSDWTGTGTIAGAGGADTIAATKNFNFVVADTSLTSTDGMSLALNGIAEVNLTGGDVANLFNMAGWTGTATIAGGTQAVGTFDRISMVRDASFTLTNTSLAYTPVAGVARNWSISGLEHVYLTGGVGNNSFTVSGWTGGGGLTGGGGSDTVVATKNVATITLTDIRVTASDGLSMRLTNIGTANLTGGNLANAFNLTGWTGNATIGAAGQGAGTFDVLTYERDASFALANASLAITPVAGIARTWTISGFEQANLTGGLGDNTFDVSAWTNVATVTGGGGVDTIASNKNADMTLTNTSLVSGTMNVTLSGITRSNLTTTNTATRLINASGFSGNSIITATGNANVRLLGGAGNDELRVTGNAAAVLVGNAGNDLLAVSGTGRSLQIGGEGADNISNTGTGQSAMISGRTVYDNDMAALDALFAEWTSGRTFAARVANMLAGTGSTGGRPLNASTVFDDLLENDLLAATAAGQSWFLVRSRDRVTQRPTDIRTNL